VKDGLNLKGKKRREALSFGEVTILPSNRCALYRRRRRRRRRRKKRREALPNTLTLATA